MKTTINTNRYERSHGKSPKGRGVWMFEDQDGNFAHSYAGLYSEAKKSAQKSGYEFLYVSS